MRLQSDWPAVVVGMFPRASPAGGQRPRAKRAGGSTRDLRIPHPRECPIMAYFLPATNEGVRFFQSGGCLLHLGKRTDCVFRDSGDSGGRVEKGTEPREIVDIERLGASRAREAPVCLSGRMMQSEWRMVIPKPRKTDVSCEGESPSGDELDLIPTGVQPGSRP
jgi:hypothetical protein